MNHLSTLFSNLSLKAWIAGLLTIVGAYAVPAIARAMPVLVLANFFDVSYAAAALVIGLVAVVLTYVVENR
jgi:hypothetical protein